MKTLSILPPVACCTPLAAPAMSDDEAAATASLFKALADPTRVRIVNMLAAADDGVCVCDLTPHLGLSQPTVSHHLRKLGRESYQELVGRPILTGRHPEPGRSPR